MEQATVSAAPVRTRLTALALVRALRPAEWLKNVFVLAAVLFSGQFHVSTGLRSAVVFAAFCAVASAGYLVNDVVDRDLDRRHPVKRNRPIASGALAPGTAVALAVLLAAAGLGAAFALSPAVCGVVAGYGALTLGYSLLLKRLVIIDVMAIAGCFLLRVAAGALAIDVVTSSWLLVCTGTVSMLLGFTKRRQEAILEQSAPFGARPVLEHYSLPFLDQMVSLVAAGTLLSYTIYATQSPLAGNQMLWTVPPVLYGILRYLYLIYQRQETRDAAWLVARDPGMIGAAMGWALAAALVVYL